jgi:hypothetical protein
MGVNLELKGKAEKRVFEKKCAQEAVGIYKILRKEWQNIHNEELHNLCFLSKIARMI